MREYYIHKGTVQEGPFSINELTQQSLTQKTAIWHEGLPAWTTAGKLPELGGLFRQTPPPFESLHDLTPGPFSLEASTKRSLIIPLTIIGLVICLGLLGLFVYNNRAAASNLDEVTQAQAVITKKQQQDDEEKRAEETLRKAVNEALTKKNREYRNNWSSYINIGDVYADIDKFWGGVSAFDIPIINGTDYMLDEDQVAVSYIKDNGTLHKKETVTIYNIPAHSTKAGQAPASTRGTSIDHQVMGIVSKGMHFCFPVNNGNPVDPFFCK